MRPWGKSEWRSLNSREFVVRTGEAFAWEWGAEVDWGGPGRGVVVEAGSRNSSISEIDFFVTGKYFCFVACFVSLLHKGII